MRSTSFLGDYVAVETLASDKRQLQQVIGELSLLYTEYPLVHLYFEPHHMTIEASYFDQYSDLEFVTTAYYNRQHGYWTIRSAT